MVQTTEASAFLTFEDGESVENPSEEADQGSEQGTEDPVPDAEKFAIEDGEVIDETEKPDADPEESTDETPETKRVAFEDAETTDEVDTPESGDDNSETGGEEHDDSAA